MPVDAPQQTHKKSRLQRAAIGFFKQPGLLLAHPEYRRGYG
jgi:hypothetical protein